MGEIGGFIGSVGNPVVVHPLWFIHNWNRLTKFSMDGSSTLRNVILLVWIILGHLISTTTNI